MKIAIVGSGALGLYYGAKLAQAGNDVHFLLRRDYAAIKANGLQVYSVRGDFHLQAVQAYRTPEEMGEADLVVVGLKTFANESFKELMSPLVSNETQILTLQNGLGNEEMLADIFGADHIIGGVAFLASNRGNPGVVHHLGEGRILLGEFSRRGITSRTESLADLFRNAEVECHAVADLPRSRWEKLIWNIPFNGLCALMQSPVDVLLHHDRARSLILDIMGEVIAAANAQGLTEPISRERARQMVDFTGTLGSYKPSMQIDREQGRPLELGSIFAIPLERAAAKGVVMPKVEELYALLDLGENKFSVPEKK